MTSGTLQPATNPVFEFLAEAVTSCLQGAKVNSGAYCCYYQPYGQRDIWNHNQGRFGWFDFEDDLAISQKLLRTSRKGLKATKMFPARPLWALRFKIGGYAGGGLLTSWALWLPVTNPPLLPSFIWSS